MRKVLLASLAVASAFVAQSVLADGSGNPIPCCRRPLIQVADGLSHAPRPLRTDGMENPYRPTAQLAEGLVFAPRPLRADGLHHLKRPLRADGLHHLKRPLLADGCTAMPRPLRADGPTPKRPLIQVAEGLVHAKRPLVA